MGWRVGWRSPLRLKATEARAGARHQLLTRTMARDDDAAATAQALLLALDTSSNAPRDREACNHALEEQQAILTHILAELETALMKSTEKAAPLPTTDIDCYCPD